MITVYVSIGNSDDKLSQAEWASFVSETSTAILLWSKIVHGQWLSEPASQWQNACWCFEIGEPQDIDLRRNLRYLASRFSQDSITWSPVKETEFLGPW